MIGQRKHALQVSDLAFVRAEVYLQSCSFRFAKCYFTSLFKSTFNFGCLMPTQFHI